MSHKTYSVATGRIVDVNGHGDFTTIAAALTASVSGQTIFIRPGTYTENLTLKAGVDLAAFDGDQSTPNVTIAGTCTFTAAGTVSISGIRLQTNAASAITVSGTLASVLHLNNCYLDFTNNTGITFSTTSASAMIFLDHCRGDLGTTGIAYFAQTSPGVMTHNYCFYLNTGASTTANTCSEGRVTLRSSTLTNPLTTSSTGILTADFSNINCAAINATALTCGGGTSSVQNSSFAGGTASAISVGAGTTLNLAQSTIASTNTNAITGAGILGYSDLAFSSTSNTINTTTQTANISRPGITRSAHQPAFLAYLAAGVTNKTGAGTTYTLGTDALTEVFDQGSNFNTNGTFTAPYTGIYQLNCGVSCTGTTVATSFVLSIVTSNRTYQVQYSRTASNANETPSMSILADMDVNDTATATINVFGEAGDTVDIGGGANPVTFFSGHLVC